jgi:hypothetical protein
MQSPDVISELGSKHDVQVVPPSHVLHLRGHKRHEVAGPIEGLP